LFINLIDLEKKRKIKYSVRLYFVSKKTLNIKRKQYPKTITTTLKKGEYFFALFLKLFHPKTEKEKS
jgi:hypothetical protein